MGVIEVDVDGFAEEGCKSNTGEDCEQEGDYGVDKRFAKNIDLPDDGEAADEE